MTKITARRVPKESGLAGVAQGPRGFTIYVNCEPVASVFAQKKGWEFSWTGWKVNIFKSEKVETRRLLRPGGQPEGWPLTDEGLEEAKKVALDLVKEYYK